MVLRPRMEVDMLRGHVAHPSALRQAPPRWVAERRILILVQPTIVALASWRFDHPSSKRAARAFVLAACEGEIPDVRIIPHEKAPPFRHIAARSELSPARDNEGPVNPRAQDSAARWQEDLTVVVIGAGLQAGELARFEFADLRRALRRSTRAQIRTSLHMTGCT